MSLIDLHVHSNASDGSLSPSEVVSLAAEAGLSAIALTDHDTVSGVQEALDAAADQNITVVPGVELSCLYHDREIHLLGLFINHQDPDFLKFLKDAECVSKRRASDHRGGSDLWKSENDHNKGTFRPGASKKRLRVFCGSGLQKISEPGSSLLSEAPYHYTDGSFTGRDRCRRLSGPCPPLPL